MSATSERTPPVLQERAGLEEGRSPTADEAVEMAREVTLAPKP